MCDRVAEVVILAEDRRAARLMASYVRRALDLGRPPRIVLSPPGKGAADGWVISRYPVEVAEYRRRRSRGRNLAALVVHVDADNQSVADRHRSMNEALGADGQRVAEERIALVVPRRNVETWIHGLCGVPVDEQYDFKLDPRHLIAPNEQQRERLREQQLRPAAMALYGLTRRNAPAPPAHLPALATAVDELRRL